MHSIIATILLHDYTKQIQSVLKIIFLYFSAGSFKEAKATLLENSKNNQYELISTFEINYIQNVFIIQHQPIYFNFMLFSFIICLFI